MAQGSPARRLVLRLAPAESTELQRSIRTSIAGWRKELHTLHAVLPHPRCVNAVAFSPDGATLLTACSDGRARLWACATGEPLGPPLDHLGRARAAGLAIEVPGKEPLFYPKHFGREHLLTVAYRPDGSLFATGGADGNGPALEARRRPPGRPAARPPDKIHCSAFTPDDARLLTGCTDGQVRFWDVATGEPAGEPLPHPDAVLALVLSPNGTECLTACADGRGRLWDLKGPRRLPLDHSDERPTDDRRLPRRR